MEIPKSNDKFMKIAAELISNNNKIKIEKTLKLFKKLSEKQKDNNFVSARDLFVLGCVCIGSVSEVLSETVFSEAQRKELEEMKRIIYL